MAEIGVSNNFVNVVSVPIKTDPKSLQRNLGIGPKVGELYEECLSISRIHKFIYDYLDSTTR